MTMRLWTPTETKDGVNKIFTTDLPYLAGTVHHVLNGQVRFPTDAVWGLTELGGTAVELHQAPAAADTLELLYDDGSVQEAATSFKVVLSVETLALPKISQGRVVPIVAGDRRPRLYFHFTTEGGANLDLTNTRPWFRLRRVGDAQVLNYPTAMSIDNAAAGLAHYDWQTGDTCAVGMLEAEVGIDYGNGVHQSMYELLRFSVRRGF